MNREFSLRVTKANFKKQISALTVFALGFSLLGLIAAREASALNNYATQTISAEAIGRAGGNVKAQVQAKLAPGSSTSTDQIAVGIVSLKSSTNYYNNYNMDSSNFTSTSFATTQIPSSVSNAIATYNFSFTAPTVAGTYALGYCISSSTTAMTHSALVSGTTFWNPSKTPDLNCQWRWIQVGGAPVKAVASNNSLSAFPNAGLGLAEANSQIAFFDSAGFRTRLQGSELFTITSTSAALSASYGINYPTGTGTIPSSSSALVFNVNSGDADGNYRFKMSDSINRNSGIKGQFESTFGSGNFATPAISFSFSTSNFTKTGFTPKLLEAGVASSSASFASGTDGKLYFWGSLGSAAKIALPAWVLVGVNKPKKMDFLPISGQENSTTISQIISANYFLSSDGVIYHSFVNENASLQGMNQQILEPEFYPSLNGVRISSATSSMNYILDSQGRVWKRTYSNFDTVIDYSLVDLSSFGNPTITQIDGNGTTFFLTSAGEILSQGSNANGLLGQNSNLSPTSIGRVLLPDSATATQVVAGYDFAYAVASNGSVWSWGNNAQGQQGKDTTLIPYAISPILVIMPVGVQPTNFGINRYRISFLSALSKVAYSASSTGWAQVNLGNSFPSELTFTNSSMNFYSYDPYMSSFITAQADGRVYAYGNVYGNCNTTPGYIRSVGQFGPVSTDDAIRYSGLFLETESGTSTVNTTFSLKVGETSTLQVVQPRTNCYDLEEIQYKWDLDNSGNFATPAVSSLSQTGYQAFSTNLNFSSAGRKTVKLKLTSPDGLDLFLNFTIGVEPITAPVIDFGDTSTAMISGSSQSALGIGIDGRLYTWGYNNFGQLSAPIATYSYRYLPMSVSLPGNAKPRTVFSYYYNYSYQANYVVDTSGRVWGAGNSYAINGSVGSIESFTVLSYLASYTIVDMQAAATRAVALTKSGQIITWQLGTTGSGSIPSQIVSLAGINIKTIAVQNDGNSGIRINAIDTDGNLWLVPISSGGVVGDATKVSPFSNVRQLSFNGTQATIVAADGSVWYSVNGSSPFAQVSLPAGVTAVDAMANGTMYLLDSTKKIWTASPSQSGNVVTMSTWTAYAAQLNGQASSTDQPIFQHKGSSFISFASGNLLYTGYYSDYQAGRCNVNGISSSGNRVYSTGQFGAANVVDQISTQASVAIASQNATNFSNGQFFSANAGDAVVIRMVNPTSGCFNGSSQLTAVADTAGDGNFSTAVPLSNDGGGSYSFTLSGTAPTSGRKSISLKISTPLGTSSTISLGLGVFGTETITAIVPRTNPLVTSDAAAFAVASDGYAYGWSTPTDVSYDYNGSTMTFMNMITSTPPRNAGSPTKLQLPGNVHVREAVPFTYCCSRTYGRYVFGVLAVDEYGRTWTWASESGIYMANTYAYGSVPTTATQVPGLVGENVIRIAVSPDGHRAMALTSKGIVYTWADEYAGNMMNARTLTKVAGLAGLKILDIFTTSNMSYALTDTGDVYAFNGYVAYAGIGATYQWEGLYNPTKVLLPETATSFMNLADSNITAIKSATGKIYVWGQYNNRSYGLNIPLMTPVRIDLPNNRTPGAVGTISWDGYSGNVITASDGTWWTMAANAQNQIVLYQRAGVSSEVNTTVTKFASGAGQAMVLQNGSIYTTNSQIAGTCGPISSYTRVMSDGQFGPLYKADQVYITVNGNEITRPNTPTSVSVTGWSACDGGAGITLTADYIGNNIFGDTKTATVSQDGSNATSTFTFTKTANGPVYMHFKATTASGLSGTTTFFTKVVPAPLPGRQIGISINAGDRYTNSSNVSLSLVWPDGTTKIFVSNDGGFAPGTVSDYDLQYTVPWVLPPQAVIPLPSIVYARFDNDPNTYYFDDIILDAIVPVLTYASAR